MKTHEKPHRRNQFSNPETVVTKACAKPRPDGRAKGSMVKTVKELIGWYRPNETGVSVIAHKERWRIRSLFLETYGTWDVDSLNGADFLDFLNQHVPLETHANWTRRRWMATIRSPFTAAAQAGLIHRNPFAQIKYPRGDRGRDLTDDEFRAMLREATPAFRRVVAFLRFSGARPVELRRLEWSHIRRRLNVILQREHKTAHTTEKPRTIRLNTVTIKLLAWIHRHNPHERYVFVNSKGQPWTIRALGKQTESARKRMNLPADAKLYGCRHAFATGAIVNGVELKALSHLMGHTSTKTTEHYVHLAGRNDLLTAAAEQAIGRGVRKDVAK